MRRSETDVSVGTLRIRFNSSGQFHSDADVRADRSDCSAHSLVFMPHVGQTAAEVQSEFIEPSVDHFHRGLNSKIDAFGSNI